MPASHIADMILFLASDQAAMINGASIPVDQGVSYLSACSERLYADVRISGALFRIKLEFRFFRSRGRGSRF